MSDKVIIVSVVIALIIIMSIIVFIYLRNRSKKIKNIIENLDREKNIIESTPII